MTAFFTIAGRVMDGLGVLIGVALFGGYPLLDGNSERIRELGIDAYGPIHADRQLHLAKAQVLLAQKTGGSGSLRLRLGIDVLRATGSITQIEPDGTGGLRTVRYDSPAWGAGPVAEGSWSLYRQGSLDLGLDLSAGVLLFDRGFPAGGLRYNGMFSVGPGVSWSTAGGGRVQVGMRFTHLSNGHGVVAHNPSFEGRGITVRWQMPL